MLRGEHQPSALTAAFPQRLILGLVFLGSLVMKATAQARGLGLPQALPGALGIGTLFLASAAEVSLLIMLCLRNLVLAFRFAAALAVVFFVGIMLLRLSGKDAAGCGCFGAIRLPLLAHVCLLLGILLVSWSGVLAITRRAATSM